MKLYFFGFDVFSMTVQDIKDRDIKYPLPPVTYPHNVRSLNEGSSSQQTSVIPRDWSTFQQYHLKISFLEATTGHLVVFAFIYLLGYQYFRGSMIIMNKLYRLLYPSL